MEFFLFSVTTISVFSYCIKGQTAQTFLRCFSPTDCRDGRQCCGDVCRKWRDCRGVCDKDKDCDEIIGEKCVKSMCKCKRSPCNEVVFPDPNSCKTMADCQKDEICNKHSLCVKADTISSNHSTGTNSLNWRTVLILVLSVLVAVILVAVFIRCTFRARAERGHARCSRNSRHDSFFPSVRWRRNMASSCAHNRYNYESAATNITIDLNEDSTRIRNSDTPPEYNTASDRPGTPPPSYEEAVTDSNSRSVSSCVNSERDDRNTTTQNA